jgi:hypothetical protein
MVPGRREWDVQLLKSVLYPHDVQEVLKVRLSNRAPEDHVGWFYEISGIFTVRSAYHLVVTLDKPDGSQEGCSARNDGSRLGYKRIWSANVPPKVRVFTWRLSQEGLATQTNRKNRGLEDESGYHAVVRYPNAV